MDPILCGQIDHRCSTALIDIIKIAFFFEISRIKQFQIAIIRQCAARIRAIPVIFRVRIDRDTCVLPVQQIRRLVMTPALIPASGILRRILKKHMIISTIIA